MPGLEFHGIVDLHLAACCCTVRNFYLRIYSLRRIYASRARLNLEVISLRASSFILLCLRAALNSVVPYGSTEEEEQQRLQHDDPAYYRAAQCADDSDALYTGRNEMDTCVRGSESNCETDSHEM